MVPPWSTFGQKIFFAEKTMSLESSRARGPQEFFCSGKLAPKTAQTRVLKTGVCTGSRPAGAATRNPQLEWVCPIRVFGGKMAPKRGQKARTEAAEATAHECARVRKWKQNEQDPRRCTIRRGIARFVFMFLRARVASVPKTRGPYVQAGGHGSERGSRGVLALRRRAPEVRLYRSSRKRAGNRFVPWVQGRLGDSL